MTDFYKLVLDTGKKPNFDSIFLSLHRGYFSPNFEIGSLVFYLVSNYRHVTFSLSEVSILIPTIYSFVS